VNNLFWTESGGWVLNQINQKTGSPMKLFPRLAGIGILFIGTILTCGASTLLTFDELPTPEVIPGLNYTNIPNGYGGLLWNNFGVLDGAICPANEGYHAGMVSSNNVAFNCYGAPASISVAGGSFNLESAYLTLALNLDTSLDIEVQGFAGATLLYDNTCTVNRSAPTLVNFNYLGVDRVTFISSPEQQFAMDNLTVTIVPEPNPAALLSIGAALGALRMVKRKLLRA
jgi:hypothetical protein